VSSITKEPNGRYRARYRDLNGRSRSKNFVRRADAQRFLDEAATDMRRGEWIDPRHQRETFDHWADRWWKTTIRLQPSTRRGYWYRLERHVRPYFGNRKVVDIDFTDVEDFIAEELAAGLSHKTVREAVLVASLVLQYAVRGKARRDNPAAGHKLGTRRRKIREGDVLDMAEAVRLVAEVRDPYKPAVWLMLLCGLRPSELCGLRVRSVDFTRNLLHVTETLQPVNRFADQPYRMVEGPTKTDAGNRTIPIPAWLSNDLAAMLAARAKKNGRPIDTQESLFVTREGNPLNRDRFREYAIRPAMKRAGLPQGLRPYDLRHSHASLLIDQGANVLAVAQRMGHTDAGVTLKVYGHLFEGVQAKLTEQLDALRARAADIAEAERCKVVPLRHGRR
jgi:integrase